jgi:hypothetical protein
MITVHLDCVPVQILSRSFQCNLQCKSAAALLGRVLYITPSLQARIVLDPSEEYTFHARDVIVEVKHTGLVVDDFLRLNSKNSTSVLSCGVCGDKDSNCVLLVGGQSVDDSAAGSAVEEAALRL